MWSLEQLRRVNRRKTKRKRKRGLQSDAYKTIKVRRETYDLIIEMRDRVRQIGAVSLPGNRKLDGGAGISDLVDAGVDLLIPHTTRHRRRP